MTGIVFHVQGARTEREIEDQDRNKHPVRQTEHKNRKNQGLKNGIKHLNHVLPAPETYITVKTPENKK